MVLSLVELCFISIMEKMEYNNEDLQRIPLNLIEKLISFMVSRLHPSDVSIQTRPIKINLVRQNRCITMRFSIHAKIEHVIHQIYDRLVNEEKRDFLEKTLQNRRSLSPRGGSNNGSPATSPTKLIAPPSPSSPTPATTTTTTTTANTSNININLNNLINNVNNSSNNNNIEEDDIASSSSGSSNSLNSNTEEEEERIAIAGFTSSWGEIERYGLFQQAGQFRNARWLKPECSLADYDIDPNETLEFKNTKCTLKIKFYGPWERVVHPLHQGMLLDETVKTFIVDESKTVSEISKDLAHKLSLRYPEELSLKRETPDEDVGTWLVSDLTLPEQQIDPLYNIFYLKRQFCFAKDIIIDFSMNPDMLHFVFCQCFDAIIDGSYPCSSAESILFAALQCQICFGDYQKDFQIDSVRLKDYLPSEYVVAGGSQRSIQKEIVLQYQKLAGMTEQKAKLNYIQLAKSLKTYGYTFFKVSMLSDEFLFGISSETILILNPETKNSIHLYSLSNVRKWQVLNQLFSIEFVDKKMVFTTMEAEAISYVLSSYIHHSLRNNPSIQKQWDKDYSTVAKISSRRRLSTCSVSSKEEKRKNYPGIVSKKCPLYIEPKKQYINPLYTLENSDDRSKKDLYKDNKVTKVMRVLTDLSSKMIQTFSKGTGVQEREIIVKFSDKKVKTFVVDEMKSIVEITQEIGNRVGIKNTEDFSLQIQNNEGLERQLDEFFVGNGTWLRPYVPLTNQDVPSDAKLMFKKKFYSFDTASDDCHNDPVYFNLLFFQSRDAIISNTYAASMEESIQLAATLFQINFGDHNPTIHKAGFLKQQDLKFFLPLDCLELWGMSFQKIEKHIYKEHRNLRGIKEVYAKFRYVQLCRSLKTFGATFFSVKQKDKNHNPFVTPYHNALLPSNSSLLLGFSRKCILIMIAKTRKLLLEFPLTHLRKWSYSKEQQSFSLDFGDYSQGVFVFQTSESEEISLYLSDYIDYLQTKIVGSQSFFNNVSW